MTENTLAKHIADGLRRDILLGVLAPGTLIKERDTSAERGVSRTPLREAIRILSSEGLVMLRPSRSPIVANPSLKEITDDAVVMTALENLGAKLACQNGTDAEFEVIREKQELMEQISDTADPVDCFEVDMMFHRLIIHASHNDALIETHEAYLSRLWRPRFLAASRRIDRPRVLRQHHDIVRGLFARDLDLVSAEIESHMSYLVLNITEIYKAAQNASKDGAAGDATDSESHQA